MREKQTKEEKIASLILQSLYKEKVNTCITDAPDICLEKTWVEVLNISPEILYKISAIHNLEKSNMNLKKIHKITSIDEDEENFKKEVTTKPKNSYNIDNWIAEIRNKVLSKIEKYDTYCENTDIDKGILCLYLQFYGTIYWKPDSFTKCNYIYKGGPLNVEALETGIKEAKLTVDGTILNYSEDNNSDLLKINNLKKFKEMLKETKVFNSYDSIIVINPVNNRGAISDYRVSIHNNEQDFKILHYSIDLLSTKLHGFKKGRYENYNGGEICIKRLEAKRIEYTNKRDIKSQ